ncbi:MAG TPA: DUF4097 family beta strand repeat-containing protein [Longimicrobiaceae bacterium]|nr:DUF4097 family beta strand repeat-containing protein [Longimicrobiaceae bacterium]
MTLGIRCLACCATLLLTAPPVAAQQRINAGHGLNPSGLIRIWSGSGSLRIVGWDRDSVSVSGTIPRGRRFHLGGSRAGIKAAIDLMEESDVAHLEVRVPRRSQVWVKTAASDVVASGLSGGLDVYTVTGNVTVSGNLGAASLESMGGTVAVSGSVESLRAKTASGDLRLSGTSEDAVATTVSGTIRLDGARFQRGRFESVDGRIVYAGAVPPGSGLVLETHSGGVEFALPRGTAGEFTVHTLRGEIRNELATSVPVRRSSPARKLDFTLGTANGTQVNVRSFRGSVVLRRQ